MKKLVAVVLSVLMLSASAATAKPIFFPFPHKPIPICKKCVKPVPHNSSGAPGVVYGIIGCAGGVVLAALVKNFQAKRELTQQEAMTCGITAFFTAN